MSIKTSNYCLTEAYNVPNGGGYDTRTLPQGAFVSPVDTRWVPKHVLESEQHRWFDPQTETFAYSRYGFVRIPKKILRET